MSASSHPEHESDRRADKRTFVFFLAFLLMSFVIESTSLQIEANTAGKPIGWVEPWLREFASHFMLLVLLPIFPILLNRIPWGRDTLMRALFYHFVAILLFSIVHVLGMVAIRKLLYPVALGSEYIFGLFDPLNWIYEIRKDAATYLLFIFGFLMSRVGEQRRLEREVASDQAKQDRRIILKSGGRSIFIEAGDIIWAKAAGNYVEVNTGEKTHLARMTLKSLETLLSEASSGHIRVHRSLILKRQAVEEIVPRGQGDVDIKLTTGEVFQGSRRYRDRLAQ